MLVDAAWLRGVPFVALVPAVTVGGACPSEPEFVVTASVSVGDEPTASTAGEGSEGTPGGDASGTTAPAASDTACPDDACPGPSSPDPADDDPEPPGGPSDDGVSTDGGGVPCTRANDCTMLPVSDACRTRACTAGVCELEFAPDGTEVDAAAQTAGDCLRRVCDGQGGVRAVVDDTDPPNDGFECTVDTCEAGIPRHAALPEGSTCSAGVCDSLGACTGCVGPEDCTVAQPDCQVPSCSDGSCGIELVPDGTSIPGQVVGDCERTVCDGNGGERAIFEPQDGDTCGCLTDEHCSGFTPTCGDQGVCVCDETSCSGVTPVCADGVCVGCTDDDCPAFCDEASGACVSCVAASDCTVPECFLAVCTQGECEQVAQPPGTSCGAGASLCSEADACDGEGSCAPNHLPAGFSVDGTAGDCQALRCDGFGGAELVADDTDLPLDDGLGCDFLGCAAGTPTTFPRPAGTPLPLLGVCLLRECDGTGGIVTTPDDGLCSDGQFCNGEETCSAQGQCQSSSDPCPGPGGPGCSNSCDEARDACNGDDPPRSPCGQGGLCDGAGDCRGCLDDEDCADDGLFCNGDEVCGPEDCEHTGNPCASEDPPSGGTVECQETTDSCVDDCPPAQPFLCTAQGGARFCASAPPQNAPVSCVRVG